MLKNLIMKISNMKYLPHSILISFVLCYSLYLDLGPKVDESEVVNFSVGFLNGDLDPHWYGYGTLPMYLLSIIYYTLFIVFDFLGVVESKLSYTKLLFTSNYFFDLARLFFTICSVFAFFIYSEILKSITKSKLVAVFFLLIVIVHEDTFYYSNYIRVDNFLNIFFACLVYLIYRFEDSKLHAVKLGIVVACLACTKINSLSVLPVVPLYFLWYYSLNKLKQIVNQSILFFASFAIFSFIMQPFGNVFIRAFNIFSGTIVENNFFSYSKEIHEGGIDVFISIIELLYNKLGTILSFGFILSILFFKRFQKIKVILLFIIFLFVAPFLFYWEVTEYWFIPLFPMLNFIALVGYYSFFEFINVKIQKSKISESHIINKLLPAFVSVLFLFMLKSSIFRFKGELEGINKMSNKDELVEFISSSLNESGNRIIVDAHYNYIMPEFVAESYKQFVDMSNVLDYNRNKNEWLQYAFKSYYIDIKKETKYKAEIVRAFDITDSLELDRRKHSYFVVSPFVYNRFLNNQGKNYPDDKLETLEMFKTYYSFYLNKQLYKSFDKEAGIKYEIYYIE